MRFDNIIRTRLTRTEILNDLLGHEFYANVPKPTFLPLPDSFWALAGLSFGRFLWFVNRATFPVGFREKFEISWSQQDERKFRQIRRGVNLIWKTLPEQLRYLPQAHRAISDARQHPERYRQETSPYVGSKRMGRQW